MTSGSRFYWLAASLVTTVVTARFLGPEGRGIYVAAVGWVTLFATVGNISLSQVIIYLTAARTREKWLDAMLGSSLWIVAMVTGASWGLASLLYVITGGGAFQHIDGLTLAIAFLMLPVLLWTENGNSILLAQNRLPVVNVSHMMGATAALGLTFLAVAVIRSGVRGALIAMAIAQGLAAGWALSRILRQARAPRVDRTVVRQLLGGGVRLHLNAVGTYLFAQANVLILNHYRDPEETAYFQLAVQLLTAIQIVPTAVSSVCYSLVSQKGADGAWPEQRSLLLKATLLTGLIAAAAYPLAPWGVQLLFGSAFQPTVPLFRILLLTVVGQTFAQVMASQWIGRGLFLLSAGLTLLIGGFTMVANYYAIPAFGGRGAAWVMVATYSVFLVTNGILAVWVQGQTARQGPAGAAAVTGEEERGPDSG